MPIRSHLLGVRHPFDGAAVVRFLSSRAVSGVEYVEGTTYTRTLRLDHGPARVRLEPGEEGVSATLDVADPEDESSAMVVSRRIFDLDADPSEIDAHLAADETLAPWVSKRPGLRVPGVPDGFEAAVRAVVGQQISVAGARTVLSRLVAEHGEQMPGAEPNGWLFPSAAAMAAVDPATLPMPRSRGRCLVRLAQSVAVGDLLLEPGADPTQTRKALRELPGIGPWTADYIALRALGDRDVFLATDLGARKGLARMGAVDVDAQRWSPWRSYALMHVWAAESEGDERA